MSTETITLTLPRPPARVGWLALGATAGLAMAILAGPALAPHRAFAVDPADTKDHTLAVSGTGRVVLTPDTADLRLGVTATAATVKDARNRSASAMTAVIASLRRLGVAEADIRTTNLSLQAVYDYSAGTTPPRLTGYTLSNVVAVTIRDLDLVAPAIDGGLAAGATSLDGVTFRVSDQTAAEKQAREAAMGEAKAKAKTLADAAGVALTGVASISESAAPITYPVYFGAAAGAAKDVATPVQPGTTEVTITVSVVYLIG